jgi:hypothetical protein
LPLNLCRYLKENVKGDTNLLDIQDEMEEVISNAIEQRHRFMVRRLSHCTCNCCVELCCIVTRRFALLPQVDILLLMGLLEEESEQLNKRIVNFQSAGE